MRSAVLRAARTACLVLTATLPCASGTLAEQPEPEKSAPIVIPLSDSEREVVILPNLPELERLGWRMDSFRRSCWDRVRGRDHQSKGRFDPALITFGEYYLGGRSDRPVRLHELAGTHVRELTFLPVAELRELAQKLIADTEAALGDIERLRGRAKGMVPLLLPRLRDARKWGDVHTLCSALKRIGPHADAAVPVLVHKIEEAEDGDKSWYSETLAAIGPAAIPALEGLLTDGKGRWVKGAAARGLSKAGEPGLAAIYRAMRHRDPLVRSRAANALLYNSDPNNIGPLVEALDDVAAEVRVQAAQSLRYHGPAARAAIPKLLRLLEFPKSRWVSVITLGHIHSDAKTVVPRLIPFLTDRADKEKADELCCSALEALEKYGPDAKPALQQIIACLKRKPRVVKAALGALAGVGGKDAATAVDPVAVFAASKDRDTCGAALRALYAMGPDAAPALKRIRKALRGECRGAAVSALAAIGPAASDALPDVVPLLVGHGSVPMRPIFYVRAMTAIDYDLAKEAIRKDMAKRKKVGDGWRVHDLRKATLHGLDRFRKLAEAVQAGAESRYVYETRFGQGSRWDIVKHTSRAVRPGDSVERAVALMGAPFSAKHGMLLYEQPENQRRIAGWREKLEIVVRDGRVVQIKPGYITEP